MKWRRKGKVVELPPEVRAHFGLERKERLLAHEQDDNTGAFVAVTTTHLVVATPEAQLLRRPWHEVDAGAWSPDTWTLSVTWVDGARAGQWTFRDQAGVIAETFHERVQASVVRSEPLGLKGPNGNGRVVVRRDLATGDLLLQTVLGRRVDTSDPAVGAAIERVSAGLRDDVGL